MPSTHAIQLRFIRRTLTGTPEENSALDDTLSIHKLGENNLRVTYTERTVDGVMTDTTMMTYQKMIHYVSRILWLLGMDADPFFSVQLMIPGYPTVLVPIARIQEQSVMILDLLINTCWHWPVVGRTPPLVTPNRTRAAGEPTVREMLREARGPQIGNWTGNGGAPMDVDTDTSL
jgi:hypothetical protein